MSKPTERFGIKPPREVRDIEIPPHMQPGAFAFNISVGWGDCDPAQIAYTGNIPAWSLRAIEAWYKACLGVGWYEINLDHGVGTPFVHLTFDFKSPVTPRWPLECKVFVARLGRSSLAHIVEGFQDDRLCFVGRTVSAFVAAGAMRALAIPPNMRAAIRAYAEQQGRAFDQRDGPEPESANQ